MKKSIVEIGEGIYMLENYISLDTASYLINVFSRNLIETERPHIYGGPSSAELSSINTLGEYAEDDEHNMATDILNSVLLSQAQTLSEFYNELYSVKSSFFSVMKEGAVNHMHSDNTYLNGRTEEENGRDKDKSGILYLNDNYLGGEIYFPNQDVCIRPNVGSFIFFEGSAERPHEVKEVLMGDRANVVSFFWQDPNRLKNK